MAACYKPFMYLDFTSSASVNVDVSMLVGNCIYVIYLFQAINLGIYKNSIVADSLLYQPG